jgi:hypothetical protein
LASTRTEILVSLLQQFHLFDERVGHLLNSNRRHVALSAKRVADSQAQMERTEARERRRVWIDRAALTRGARS